MKKATKIFLPIAIICVAVGITFVLVKSKKKPETKPVEVKPTLVQGVSSDYSNALIDWSGAGVTAPADPNASFAALSGEQKLVVAEHLGYVFDYYSMPGQSWDGGNEDPADDVRRPDVDAPTSRTAERMR